VLSEKKILNETKYHNPPFKLNGRSLNMPGKYKSSFAKIRCEVAPLKIETWQI
jgi:phenylpropionate dioxygenase-like ring-hydroxylating dioxygenase large terminal subunit